MYSLCTYTLLFSFFFNDTATTEIYTLSLHDALPIYKATWNQAWAAASHHALAEIDRSEEHTSELQSHSFISYAVFCLKKKNTLPQVWAHDPYCVPLDGSQNSTSD